MYEAFYSLDDPPFVLTPDPRFLLRSKGHHEILASLLYGITSQKGLMVLVGDVGTGKTTLCRALLRELPEEVQSALVLNPHLSEVELIAAILDDLGVERRGATPGELMTTLSQYLLQAGAEGKTVVVILDEAQQLSPAALEHIRLLSNLETATRKLLQIVLVGQPELEEKLALRELRQLQQRIAIRCCLGPLSKKETFRYIEHRLRVAGLPGAVPFTRKAMLRIYRYSRGIPRVINLVCDRTLMAGYSLRMREITPQLVGRAIVNLEGGRFARRRGARSWRPRPPVWRRVAAAGLVGGALLGAAAWSSGWLPPRLGGPLGPAMRVFPASGSPGDGGVIAIAGPPPAAITGGPIMAPPAPPSSAPGAASAIGAPPGVAPSHAAPIAPAAPAAAPAPPPAPSLSGGAEPVSWDTVRLLLARLLRLWGVQERDLVPAAVAAWPSQADGAPDFHAIAARHQLAATFLPQTTMAELRSIGLPALVELGGGAEWRPYLLRRMDDEAVTLVTPAGSEIRVRRSSIEAAGSAWILWRNVDLLPTDPAQAMSPTVLATLALRLQKLGYLDGPLPSAYDERVRDAVQRFQRDVALMEDGIMGPRTTMALSRVVGGRFNPSILEPRTP